MASKGKMASKDPRATAPAVRDAPEDVLLVHGPTEDGRGFEVLRKRGEALYAGQMRPLEEGKAVTGELVSLRRRKDSPLLFDVDVLHRTGAPPGDPGDGSESSGPPKVATQRYRAGWNDIFGAKSRARGTKKVLN